MQWASRPYSVSKTPHSCIARMPLSAGRKKWAERWRLYVLKWQACLLLWFSSYILHTSGIWTWEMISKLFYKSLIQHLFRLSISVSFKLLAEVFELFISATYKLTKTIISIFIMVQCLKQNMWSDISCRYFVSFL